MADIAELVKAIDKAAPDKIERDITCDQKGCDRSFETEVLVSTVPAHYLSKTYDVPDGWSEVLDFENQKTQLYCPKHHD
jgi:hypothetical protein